MRERFTGQRRRQLPRPLVGTVQRRPEVTPAEDPASSVRAMKHSPTRSALALVTMLMLSACAQSASSGPAISSESAVQTSASRPAPAPAAAKLTPAKGLKALVSWNAHVACTPVLTTLSKILGTQRSPLGGATLAGGGFKPGIPDRRSTTPPCTVSAVSTLVELHRVTVGSCAKINLDGDWTCELTDPALGTTVTADFRAIHIEIDGNFRAKGWAPAIPPGGKLIDVQGFVFWDPDHPTAAFHHHSGWELHSFTAWRLAS